QMQRRSSGPAGSAAFQFGSMIEEQSREGCVPLLRRFVQRLVAFIAENIYVRLVRQQDLDDSQISVGSGQIQGSRIVVVPWIDLRSMCQEQLDKSFMAGPCCI